MPDETPTPETISIEDTPHANENEVRSSEQPVATPLTPTATVETKSQPGAGMLVLQWLVYALWGWTVVSLSVLVALVVDQMLNTVVGEYGRSYWFGEGVAYPLAAAIVLFMIAIGCDIVYARMERRHVRSGGANAIMIIHAVLFALIGIGALIMAVFGGVRLLIGETIQGHGELVTIVTSLIIFSLYAATLLRTLRPKWFKGVVVAYWAFMGLALVVSVILGIVGPAAQARLRAQDKVIESGLPRIAQLINDHANTNGELPKTLNDLKVPDNSSNDEVNQLINDKSVEYKPGEKLANKPNRSLLELQRQGLTQLGGTEQVIYHYQLCVEYKSAYGSPYDNYYSRTSDQQYSTNISTYGHDAGRECYDVQTDYAQQY